MINIFKIFPFLFSVVLLSGQLNSQEHITRNVSGKYQELKTDSVLICNSKGAYAYHKYYCSGLKRCKANVLKVSKIDAGNKYNRTACKICYK